MKKIIKQKFSFTKKRNENEQNNILNKEQILYFIEKNKKYDNKKYKISDILVFTIDIEPSQIKEFIDCNMENTEFSLFTKKFFRQTSIFDDIIIPSSLFLFHSFFGIYFVFKEQENPIKKMNYLYKGSLLKQKEESKMKSIIKKYKKTFKINDEASLLVRKTKRVNFDVKETEDFENRRTFEER
jgi:hypothetical protein